MMSTNTQDPQNMHRWVWKVTQTCSGCSSAGRAGRLVIGRSLVQIPALGWAACWSVLEQDTVPPLYSSVRALRWAGDLSREHPALALRQGWDWLQQQHPMTPWKGISGNGPWHEMLFVSPRRCQAERTFARVYEDAQEDQLCGSGYGPNWSPGEYF